MIYDTDLPVPPQTHWGDWWPEDDIICGKCTYVSYGLKAFLTVVFSCFLLFSLTVFDYVLWPHFMLQRLQHRKDMGISYVKRLAASKAPWPSWEFKQEQARGQQCCCSLCLCWHTFCQVITRFRAARNRFLMVPTISYMFLQSCHLATFRNQFPLAWLWSQDQFKFCNHTMLGDIKVGHVRICRKCLSVLPGFLPTLGGVRRWRHSLHHHRWAQTDVGMCSPMGWLNLGHWTMWPSRIGVILGLDHFGPLRFTNRLVTSSD